MAKRGGRSGRKYVRDNRGRFATTGATARGGRLKTASGKKRAAQTVKAKTGGKPSGALKAKPRSEGQKYAGRVQAGKDLKRSQSVASQKKFLAKTQKRLDAAPLAQSRAAKPTAARTSKAPTNTISRSPRQLNKDEKIARDVMTDKRFKSDRQRITEMRRRGVKPDADVIGLVARVRSKQGGGTTSKIKPAAAKPTAAKTAKRRGAVGKISEAKAGRIVARMDAQRGRKALPGRRNANFVRTYERSRQFILKPSTAALKKGKPISVNESVQKAVANAAKRRKPKRRRS